MRKYFPAWPRSRSAVGEILVRRGNFLLIWTKIFYWWKLPLWRDPAGIISRPRRDNFSHMNSPLPDYISKHSTAFYFHISVHIFCALFICFVFNDHSVIDLFSNVLFQKFDYFWKHVPTKLLIPLCSHILHQT